MLHLNVVTQNSVYGVDQDDAGDHVICTSSNPEHQHIGDRCLPPEHGRGLVVHTSENKICFTSEIMSITPGTCPKTAIES